VDYNYAAAGKRICFDGLNNPQKTNMHGVLPLGFSSTTRHQGDQRRRCNGKNTDNMNVWLGYYHDYCR
jgi:hypothetical protein